MAKKKSVQEQIVELKDKLSELEASVKGTPTHAILALDVSGSMSSCVKETTEGINEYLNTLRSDKENTFFVSLLEFDSGRTEWVWECKPLAEIDSFKGFVPGGMTPLYDGIGAATSFAETVDSKFNTVLVICTDGGENSSHKYSQAQIKEILTAKQNNHDWTVIYVGANQDAWQTGNSLGVVNSFQYDINYMQSNFASIGASVSATASAYAMGTSAPERNAKIREVRVLNYKEDSSKKVDKDTTNSVV